MQTSRAKMDSLSPKEQLSKDILHANKPGEDGGFSSPYGNYDGLLEYQFSRASKGRKDYRHEAGLEYPEELFSVAGKRRKDDRDEDGVTHPEKRKPMDISCLLYTSPSPRD